MHKLIRTALDTTQARKVARPGLPIAWLGFLAVVGCAHGSASVREPAADAPAPAETPATSLVLPPFQPYTTQAPRGGFLHLDGSANPDAPLVEKALTSACRKWKLAPDPRLSQLARAVAHASDAGQLAPRGAFVGYVAQRAGLVEPTPQIWLTASSRTSLLAASIEEGVAEVAKAGGLTHCGGALIDTPDMTVLSVAFSGRFLTLQKPLPHRVADGAALPLEATLDAAFDKPSLAVTDARGAVVRVPLPARRRIQHTLELKGPGLHSVEILAEGREGVAVLAVIPILVGDAPEPPPPTFEASPAETSAESVLKNLHALIDEERKARGLKPFKRDRALAKIALHHSEDMDRHAFVAHTSKTSGNAADRVARAGLKATLVLENIGRGYSASEIHEGLMASPGHRANLLHPTATHIGLGVVKQNEGERVAFLVTELFASFAP